MLKHRNAENAADRPATAAERMRHYRARKRGENIPPRKPGPRPTRTEEKITAHPGADRGYPLNFHSVVRHVATELERAGKRGTDLGAIAATYNGLQPGDESRVRHHHGLASRHAAIGFLVDRAVSALNEQVEHARSDSRRLRLAVPFDELRYDGKEIVRRH